MTGRARSPGASVAELYARKTSAGVQGWLGHEAAVGVLAMGSDQTSHGAFGEIGVHHGKLFILLNLLRRDGEAGVAIDLFEQQDLNIDQSGRGNLGSFQANLQAHAPGRKVVIESRNSMDVTADELLAWAGGTYRLFSVDGGHTADITDNDLGLAAAVLAPDGLIILDDYFNVSWPGVSEGTNRFLSRQRDIVPIGTAHNKTFLSHREAADAYRSTLREVGERERWQVTEQEFFGVPHVICRGRSQQQRLRQTTKRLALQVPAVRTLRDRRQTR